MCYYLTDELSEKIKKIGFDKICFYYAIVKGKKENNNIIPDLNLLVKTHLNFFGVKYVSYIFTKLIIKSNCNLKN